MALGVTTPDENGCYRVDPRPNNSGAARARARVWSRTQFEAQRTVAAKIGEHAKEILAVAAFDSRPGKEDTWT